MNRLPIGIQSFKEIRTNYVYVDKTKIVHELVNSGKYLFLSRPRRFGKSLLVDTLRHLFEARKELFKGLWLKQRWNWEKSFPVIKIDMGSFQNKSIETFDRELRAFLNGHFEKGPSLLDEALSPKHHMSELVKFLSSRHQKQVVILIDEYDKPIIDNIERPEYAVEIRDYLRSFYEVFKGLDEHIRFFFMTGVSKFSRVSLFSGLNNLEDISLYPAFGTLLGYTEEEIRENFSDYLKGVNLDEMRYWYNGYNFLGDVRVYNPFDILQFLKSKKYQNYWFKTGTPSFLIKVLEERQEEPDIPGIENTELSADLLDAFDCYTMPIETLLFQIGYLTIRKEIEEAGEIYYTLELPNYEVRQSLNKELLFSYLKAGDKKRERERRRSLWMAIREGDMKAFISVIEALFAGIPYSTVNLSRYEDYYKSVLYAFLMGAGLEVIAEDITDKGRMDLSVRLPEVYHRDSPVVILELKVVTKKENKALRQIRERGYHKKYSDRSCFLVGLEFNKRTKKLYSAWEKA